MPLVWESGLSCEGVLCRSSSTLSERQNKDVANKARQIRGKAGRTSIQGLWKSRSAWPNGCETLTGLRTSFPLVVLLLQLRVGPSPPGHSAHSLVACHSYRLPCKKIMSSTTSTNWVYSMSLLYEEFKHKSLTAH